MVKITLVTNNPREVDIVPETMTVREFLTKHGVNYGLASTAIDGDPLYTEGLDMTFADHHVTGEAIVTSLPNKDNGAQAIVVGSSCVIRSTLKPDQIKKIKKIHPEALCMYDENDEMVFRLDIDETTPGSINQYGAVFGNATDPDGNATITIVIDPSFEDPAEAVYDQLGRALLYLKDMEEQIAEMIPEMSEEEQNIRSMIVRM